MQNMDTLLFPESGTSRASLACLVPDDGITHCSCFPICGKCGKCRRCVLPLSFGGTTTATHTTWTTHNPIRRPYPLPGALQCVAIKWFGLCACQVLRLARIFPICAFPTTAFPNYAPGHLAVVQLSQPERFFCCSPGQSHFAYIDDANISDRRILTLVHNISCRPGVTSRMPGHFPPHFIR